MYVIPEISNEEAENILSQKRYFLPIRFRKRTFQLKRVELIHLPFYLFDLKVVGQTGVGNQKVTISLERPGLVKLPGLRKFFILFGLGISGVARGMISAWWMVFPVKYRGSGCVRFF
jgi:hypothetical protein